MQSQKQQNDLRSFQGKPFNVTVIQHYAATTNAKEAEVEWPYEDFQDLLELTPKKKKKKRCPFHHRGLKCKSRKSRDQFSSVTKSCLTLCNTMDCSMPGFPVHHQLLELAPTHVFWVSDAIQPYHPGFSPFPPAFNLSHHQGLIDQWVNSSHQVVKVLEFQLQHQSFQWIFMTEFH